MVGQLEADREVCFALQHGSSGQHPAAVGDIRDT
jgi:hypothetical protein